MLICESHNFDSSLYQLGQNPYMQTLDRFLTGGLVSTLEASGGIGQKTSQMKAWLNRIYQEEQREK